MKRMCHSPFAISSGLMFLSIIFVMAILVVGGGHAQPLGEDDGKSADESPSNVGIVRKRAAEASLGTLAGDRDSSASAVLFRRSPLNKNFIRFGRSGYHPSIANAGLMEDDQDQLISSEEEDDDEPLLESKRSSSKLGSNFIRFGRGDPSFLKTGGYGKAFGFFPDSLGDYPYHQRRYGRSNLNSNFLRFGRR